MKMKSPESQVLVNKILSSAFNRSPVYPQLIGYIIAMRLPVLLDVDTESKTYDVFKHFDQHVTTYLIDDLNSIIPFDVQAAQLAVKSFYSWRHAMATGSVLDFYVADIKDVFTRIGTFVNKDVTEAAATHHNPTEIQSSLNGLSKLIGEINPSFK